ncbi:pyridoxal phosphate-dependent aminotransferase [Paenibacillus sp. FJAT-26967]|uniref:pyridoxal phosphate-dependent aminotransferase n=1 Tax=Paenibacillus sp. FJAT-26967 TaxID=1729690 RepID=UPI000837BB70|nr:pyridoxal phosphate-dependent aminotransferase [Paenibacillus sp. FJAT-26967]
MTNQGAISAKLADQLEKGSWIRKLFDEGKRLTEIYGADEVFDFSLGNPIVEPPAAFRQALQDTITDEQLGKHQYIPNQGLPAARQKVAEYLNSRYGGKIVQEHVVMTVGAGGGLNVVCKSLLNPGDEVILLTPYFVEYDYYADNHGGIPVHVALTDDFSIDTKRVAEAITARTRAIIVNTPGNPTGKLLSQQNLNELGDVLKAAEKKHGSLLYLLYDDPYSQLVYDAVPPNPFEAYPRTILISSFSKDLGIAGERLGYVAVDSSAENAALLAQAFVFSNRTLGFVNAPVLMQRALARMESLTVEQNEYRKRRDLMVAVLQEAGYEFDVPQGGFFIFPKTPIADDVEFCLKAVQDHRLLIVPGSGFGRGGHFRLSYSVPIRQIERSGPVFKAVLDSYR